VNLMRKSEAKDLIGSSPNLLYRMVKRNCVQLWHPMAKKWVVVDRTLGKIVRYSPQYAKPYKNVRILFGVDGSKIDTNGDIKNA